MKCFLTLLITVFTTSCSASPLLNHTTEGDGITPPRKTQTCDHYLPAANLCAAIAYDKVTSAGFSFEMVFWNKDIGTAQGPYVLPPETLKTENGETYEFGVDPYMGSMGHGTKGDKSIEFTTVNESKHFGDQENIILVENVSFVMGGKWEIRVLYGTPSDGRMPDSLEWDVFQMTEFEIDVPW